MTLTHTQEGKLKESINIGPQEQTLEEKTLTVVYGPDFVNVSFINFCTDSRDTAQVSSQTDSHFQLAPIAHLFPFPFFPFSFSALDE